MCSVLVPLYSHHAWMQHVLVTSHGMFLTARVLCFLSSHKDNAAATPHYSHAHLLHLLLMAQTAMHDSIHLSFALVQVPVR